MQSRQPSAVLILLLVATTPVSAGQAYTWTDTDGVTHFSESLPAAGANQARQVDLQHAPVIPGPPPERYRSINSQSAAMQADRLKREQAREKRRQIETKRQQQRYEDEAQDYSSYDYPYYTYPYWYGHYPRRHHHPGKHHRRHHPYRPSRPGFQPGKTLSQKHNQEALRNQHYRW